MTDQEEDYQLFEVNQTLNTPGWGHIVNLWAIQREAILKQIKEAKLQGANQEHGWEYYQGLLFGFDKTTAVIENLKRRHEEAVEKSSSEGK